MDVLSYKGYEIHARPQQNGEQWTVAIEIRKHHLNERHHSQNFSIPDAHPTRKDAVQHCFSYGKQIIDGEIEDCSVRDL